MLYWAKVYLFSDKYKTHTYIQNVKFLNGKTVGASRKQ